MLIDAINVMTYAARATFMMDRIITEPAAPSIVTLGITISMVGGEPMKGRRTPEALPRGQPRARSCCASCAAGTITIIDIGLEINFSITASIKMSLKAMLTRASMDSYEDLDLHGLVNAYTQTNLLVAPNS